MQAWYVDDTIVVMEKPAGLLAVPGRGEDKRASLSEHVRERWPDALVVHRLDMPTSGLMLFARGAAAQRCLSMAFEARRIAKRYVAVVHGLVAGDRGEIDAPLAVDWPNRPRQCIDRAHGRPSLTRWRVLARDEAAQRTRLALEPVTGRAHQLRVHLLSIGHAIVGDALYGHGDGAPDATSPRLMLHASRLAFAHPHDGHAVEFESPPPF
ncbi:MAG: RluA family pseudouridine synthase [Rubrivivax sp.]|nr:RluA family pseudouridine synthase [Rubrivivax sp.]